MIEQQILQALQTAVIAACAQSTIPTLPIKAIGRSFEPPNDQRYLEIVQIPNNITNEFWNESKTYRGMLRLILHWPIDDQGAYPPIATLQSIVSYFAKGKSLINGNVSVKITENPDFMGQIQGSPDTIYAVSVRYQCFAP